uniref:GEVED domain-containing protein n=1 Tax=Brumimicrobium sp. TaxID=2029867 RepID=UPI003A94F134
MKTKLLLLMLSVFLTSWHVNSQVFISEGFEGASAPASWTFNGFAHTSTTPCAGTGAMRVNLYSSGATAAATSPNQTATGLDINVSLDYKIIDWSDEMGTTDDFGVFNLQYSIDGGTNWITYDVIDFASHTPSTVCATRSAVIDAADVPNGSDFIWRIDGTYTTGDYYFYIDDFSAIEQVGCIAPSGLMATMTSVTSADLSWNENGGATDWNIEYGAPGFTLGSGTPVSTTTNPHSLTGLTTGADYEFYVQSDCGGSQSSWSGPYAFSVSYCEVSTSWTGDYLSSVNSMGALSNITYTATAQPSGSYADETAQSFEAFETMSFDINTSYVGGGNGVNVWVDWNNDLTFDPAELVASLANSDASKTLTVAVPAATPVGDYRMRVRGQYGSTANPPACGNVSYGTTVDFTLTIVATPSCLPPTDLNTGATSSTSADLTWTENGSATEWQVEYGAPGFTQGTGTLETATSNPHTITITPDTQYDFYVRSVCGVGDSSYWAGPFNFENMYCDVSTTWGEYLSSIESSLALTNVNYTATSQPAGSYADETVQVIEAYESLTFDVSTVYSSGSNGVNIWVDWNNNFTFEASELVASLANSSAAKTLSVTVPPGTAQGDYRMRVRGQWGSTANPPACGNVNYGSTVDFTVTITATPSCLPTSDLVASNETQTSIDLDWTENNTATTWNIEYGPEGFTPGTGTVITGVTTNPYTVSGLNPSSTYDFYVQSDCGSGDISSIGSGVTASTLCGAVLAPYYEGFESGDLPTCYENLSSNTTSTSANNFWKFTGQ